MFSRHSRDRSSVQAFLDSISELKIIDFPESDLETLKSAILDYGMEVSLPGYPLEGLEGVVFYKRPSPFQLFFEPGKESFHDPFEDGDGFGYGESDGQGDPETGNGSGCGFSEGWGFHGNGSGGGYGIGSGSYFLSSGIPPCPENFYLAGIE